MRARAIVFALILAASTNARAAEPTPAARAEIAHLLLRLENSGCEFFRNGSWYGALEARQHLERKRDYVLKQGLVRETEDFIRLAATKSSLTGQEYRVRCAGKEAVPSATWFGEELARHRSTGAP